jgi:phenylacetate-coenzyme A ligase PaaK-like adenylate-forming protein
MNLPIMLKLLLKLGQLRRHEHWTREQLEAYQAEQLRRLRTYAYTHSPFYRQFHNGLTDRPLNELPILTKALVMEHFDELVTDRTLRLADVRAYAAQGEAGKRYRNRYWVNATSGSSGHPGFFVFNDAEWISILASFARGQEWSGMRISLTRQQRMATVASISPWHVSSQVSAVAKSWWRPSLRLPASQPLPQSVEQLNAWRPDVLIAYASMAGILAEEQLAGRLYIHPRVVYTSSEVLTPQTRQRAHQAWGDEPFDQYGATETADIAAEYRACRRMHVFEDLLLAEVVDDHNRPVPLGEYGTKVLITTLFSRTQPLIRYELNDSVRISTADHACQLPFAVLESVQGRREDVLKLPGRDGGRVTVQPLVYNRVMDIIPVSGWQVIQEADDSLTLLITGVRDGLTDAALREQLTRSLAQEQVRMPAIKIEHVAAIPKTAAGKAPLVKAYRPSQS